MYKPIIMYIIKSIIIKLQLILVCESQSTSYVWHRILLTGLVD